MDSAQHCLDQSAECRRLMKLAQSETEAQALKHLARSWSGLAVQSGASHTPPEAETNGTGPDLGTFSPWPRSG